MQTAKSFELGGFDQKSHATTQLQYLLNATDGRIRIQRQKCGACFGNPQNGNKHFNRALNRKRDNIVFANPLTDQCAGQPVGFFIQGQISHSALIPNHRN